MCLSSAKYTHFCLLKEGVLDHFTSKIVELNLEYDSGWIYTKKWFKKLLRDPVVKEWFKIGGIPCVNGLDAAFRMEDGIDLYFVSAMCTKLYRKGNYIYGDFDILDTPFGKILYSYLKVERALANSETKQTFDCMRLSGKAADWNDLTKGYELITLYYAMVPEMKRAVARYEAYEAELADTREWQRASEASRKRLESMFMEHMAELDGPGYVEPQKVKKDANDRVLDEFWTKADGMCEQSKRDNNTEINMDPKTTEANWEITSKAYCEQVNKQVEEAEDDQPYDADKVLDDFWAAHHDAIEQIRIEEVKQHERSDFE